ncbi:unnamed protein product, partial [marine sediment metagenome]
TGVKKDNVKSAGLKSITENLDRILELLKRKKISVHAMFVEAEPDRVEGKTIFFCLDENKKWHKDHLSKTANSDVISEVIGEVTGNKFRVKFETGNINSKNQMKNHSSQNGSIVEDEKNNKSPGIDETEKTEKEVKGDNVEKNTVSKDKGAQAEKKPPEESGADTRSEEKPGRSQTAKDDKSSTNQKDKDTLPAKDEKEDMLKYFEKKFEIKE